jgi:hypothetical protein
MEYVLIVLLKIVRNAYLLILTIVSIVKMESLTMETVIISAHLEHTESDILAEHVHQIVLYAQMDNNAHNVLQD